MFKKKILILSATLFICIIAGELLSKARASEQAQNVEKADQQDNTTKTQDSTKETIEWSNYKSNLNQTKDNTQFKLMKQFAIAIFFVIVLGFGAFYFSKKLVPRLTSIRGKNISVIETIHLGQNRTLFVLEIGTGQRLLIGSTNNAINFLSDVTEALSVKSETQN